MRKQHEEKCLFSFCSFIPANPRIPQHSWQALRAACQGGDGVAGAGVPMETLQKSPAPAMDRVPMSLSSPGLTLGSAAPAARSSRQPRGWAGGLDASPCMGLGQGLVPRGHSCTLLAVEERGHRAGISPGRDLTEEAPRAQPGDTGEAPRPISETPPAQPRRPSALALLNTQLQGAGSWPRAALSLPPCRPPPRLLQGAEGALPAAGVPQGLGWPRTPSL